MQLQETCHTINQSKTKVLSKTARRQLHARYRAILAAGEPELPLLPPPPNGKRGRIKKSNAHNRLERLIKYAAEVRRFTKAPDVCFTNNTGEQQLRWRKSNQKSRMLPPPEVRSSRLPHLQRLECHGPPSATIRSSLLRSHSKETPSIWSTNKAKIPIAQIEGRVVTKAKANAALAKRFGEINFSR